MRNIAYLPLLLLAFGSCRDDSTTTATEADATINGDAAADAAIITPADAQRFARLLAEREEAYPLTCRPEDGKLYPADAAPSDTAFFLFRDSLLRIIAERDIFALLPHVSENIKASLGEDGGLPGFIRAWGLDQPDKIAQSPLWSELRRVLELGGQFIDRPGRLYFSAPYVDACWPAEADPTSYGAVIGAGVRMRADPGLNTRVIKTISYDLVQYLETTPNYDTVGGERHPWIKVALADGTQGFLYGKFYRSPLELRAGFERDENGAWKLVMLLEGD